MIVSAFLAVHRAQPAPLVGSLKLDLGRDSSRPKSERKTRSNPKAPNAKSKPIKKVGKTVAVRQVNAGRPNVSLGPDLPFGKIQEKA